MRPFNLEEALKGNPVQLRGGEIGHVSIVSPPKPDRPEPLLGGMVITKAGPSRLWNWDESGESRPLDPARDIVGMADDETSDTDDTASNAEQQKTHRPVRKIAGFEFPAPEMHPPAHKEWYYYPDITRLERYSSAKWEGTDTDKFRLINGFVHRSKDAANAHAWALLAINGEI